MRTLFVWPLVLLSSLLPAAPAGAAETPESRLAMQFWRGAGMVLNSPGELSLVSIETALVLAEEAVALDPDNADLWRYLASVAALAERREVQEDAVRNIVRLDPQDEVARLQRLAMALERYQTVEERIAAYERLLDPSKLGRVGPAVASRLAMDLALMHRRRGDNDAFAEALSEAVALDPSNRAAAALAAGFFRMNVNDGYAEAELLIALMLADPTDLATPVVLAELFLEHGAFIGAERMYQAATAMHRKVERPVAPNLMADYAVAMWGNRHPDRALEAIREVQKRLDDRVRAGAFTENQSLTPIQRARMYDHVHPNLASVRAAILAARDDEYAPKWIKRLLESYGLIIQITEAKKGEIDPAVVAEVQLELAWILVWLTDQFESVDQILDMIAEFRPLTDQELAKFEGWLALRRGAPEAALEAFARIPDPDGATSLGEARAHLALGERRMAARKLLYTARIEPGSLIGVTARDRLEMLLEQTLPLSPEAVRLEALIAEVPNSFERYPDAVTLAVDFKIEPNKFTYEPYEPIIINIVVTNNSPYPLAFDRDGPLRPQVLMFFSTSLARIGQRESLAPVVVDLDRRLRLKPYERLTVPVDLRRYKLGDVLTSRAYRGTFVRVKGLMNFFARPNGTLQPGLLGAEEWTPTVRVDGRDLNGEQVQSAVEAIADPFDPGDLVTMAILSQMVAVRLPPESPAPVHELVKNAREALGVAYVKLDPVSQAWLLGALPTGFTPPAIREVAQASEHRLVRLAYLLTQLSGPDDPVLAASLASGDEHLVFVAERSEELIERAIQMNNYARPAESGASP